MTGELCLRPGRAKRANNFADVAARAGEFAPCALTRLDVDRACAQGTPELTDGERSLLAFYLSHLSIVEVQNGRSCVWPGAASTEEALGISGAAVRRRKASLEKKGFLVRKYDGRNRPLEEGAIDLAPFLAALPGIIQSIEKRLDERRAAYRANRELDGETVKIISSAQAPNNERQNSPHESPVCSTGFSEEKSGEGRRSASTSNTETALRRAHEDAKTIKRALDLSPQLRKLLTPENEPLSAPEASNRIPEALQALFGSDRRGTALHTFKWALQRHGAEAFVHLAVALEDPIVKKPLNFFGKLATMPEPWDLTDNIKRVQTKNPALMTLDEPAGEEAARFARILSRLIGVPAFNSWFSAKTTRFEFEADIIRITVWSGFMADEIPNRYGLQLARAAENFRIGAKIRFAVDESLKK